MNSEYKKYSILFCFSETKFGIYIFFEKIIRKSKRTVLSQNILCKNLRLRRKKKKKNYLSVDIKDELRHTRSRSLFTVRKEKKVDESHKKKKCFNFSFTEATRYRRRFFLIYPTCTLSFPHLYSSNIEKNGNKADGKVRQITMGCKTMQNVKINNFFNEKILDKNAKYENANSVQRLALQTYKNFVFCDDIS